MSTLHSSQPIGIFDSGIGGLTVAHAVAEKLPHENFIYFGDTAHLPYGDKSALTIQCYCEAIVDFLLKKNCKLILVACNSAAAAAYEKIQQQVKNRALLLGVVDPIIELLSAHPVYKKIGLIGTKRTVESKVFEEKIKQRAPEIELRTLATPLLVPIIEENFHQHEKLVDEALKLYLSQNTFKGIEALILACTHYPIIKNPIAKFFKHKIPLLDAGEITAAALAKLLETHHLVNPQKKRGKKEFYVSDLTPAFAQMANEFFGKKIRLNKVKIP